jgi:hypothetical protein
MKYIIISAKGPKEMEETLNSKYTIKELGNTWLSNGVVYQSFLGELKDLGYKKSEPATFKETLKAVKEEKVPETPKAPEARVLDDKIPAKPKAVKPKRKSRAKKKED